MSDLPSPSEFKQRREATGASQRALAEAADVSLSTVYALETGGNVAQKTQTRILAILEEIEARGLEAVMPKRPELDLTGLMNELRAFRRLSEDQHAELVARLEALEAR
jgi:DNA-binding XRE family transcriptional regulator